MAKETTTRTRWHYHYWYQLFPAYGLFAAAVYTDALASSAIVRKKALTVLTVLLVISLPVICTVKIVSKFGKPDYPRLVGEYIASSVGHNLYKWNAGQRLFGHLRWEKAGAEFGTVIPTTQQTQRQHTTQGFLY